MSYYIQGVDVAFMNRDITQATDEEIDAIGQLLTIEKHQGGPARTITEMLIETDYITLGLGRYRLTTVVEASGPVDEEPSSPN